MRILKFPISIKGQFVISLPKLSYVLCVQVQHNIPCIWVLTHTNTESEDRKFHLYGTGHDITNEPGRYIGTFQMQGGDLIWHLFED